MTEIKYVLLLLLVWLCCSSMTVGNSYSQESFEENIYVQVFFAFPPLGEPMIVQDVYLEFKNISDGPPINTSLEAFSDGFISAEFKGMGYFMSIDAYYQSNIPVEKTYVYTDEITQEFIRAFDCPNLQRIAKSHQINEASNTIKIKQQFEYSSWVEQILLKYKPKIGFGKFIDDFLKKYVPGGETIGLTDLYYTLQKTYSGFSWNFVIGAATGKPLLAEETEYIIDLNELLNNSLPILASTHQSSIIIEIEKNRTSKIGDSILTYTLTPEDIHPNGYTIIDTEYYYVRKYEDLTTPLNDVIVKVKIGKIPSHDDYPWMATTIGIIVTIAVIVVAYAKKRKIKEKHKDEEEK
jgi:hypothetical protein